MWANKGKGVCRWERGERWSRVELCSVVMSYTAHDNRSGQNFRVGELSARHTHAHTHTLSLIWFTRRPVINLREQGFTRSCIPLTRPHPTSPTHTPNNPTSYKIKKTLFANTTINTWNNVECLQEWTASGKGAQGPEQEEGQAIKYSFSCPHLIKNVQCSIQEK